MTILNDQENSIIELGLQAARLKSDEFFSFVMNELANTYMQDIVSSKSDDTPNRESAYHAIKALQDIQARLAQMVQAKDYIMAGLAEQDDE